MNPVIQDILDDVQAFASATEAWQKRSLLQRIEIACEALRGQALQPDLGPWTVSEDGSMISSDNFDHDVLLRVSGDFYGSEPRVAYSKNIASRLNGLPKEPPAGLLESMATRLRHDFGLMKGEDAFGLEAGLTQAERKSMLSDMRKLYEEVQGSGFFRYNS